MKKKLLCPIDKLAKGVMYCYDNAKQLIADAKLLFKHKRYARAIALAVIALEEYGKSEECLLLLSCPIDLEGLDRFMKKTLRDHHGKQMAACEYEFVRAMKGKSQVWHRIADKSRYLSKEKENSLYVNMDNKFNFTTPTAATRRTAQSYITFIDNKIFEDWRNDNYDDVLDAIKEKREEALQYFREELGLSYK